MSSSNYPEESQKDCERQKAMDALHDKISAGENAEDALWRAVIAYQDYPFYTSSGLPFLYTVRRKRNGEYSGELIVSRKEESKSLTKSSVMLAFHKVLSEIVTVDDNRPDGILTGLLRLPEYKGPKAIGQIFGISYVYSLFWKLGLITVPAKIEKKLKGKS